jgi:flagellin
LETRSKEFEMANIGATTAFYKVETSLTRANNEVSKSMERLATGKQNANAGDRSSYVAMSDTFRLDYVGTKAGIKGASVAMGYLETGMRVLDSASALLSRLQELAVLGANNTNTAADNEAINLEAEAIADEFNRLMTTSTYKGKDVFVTNAGDQEIALGGRGSEMTFGIGSISNQSGYTSLYGSNRTIVGEPNNGETFNLAHLPSDAVTAKTYGLNGNSGATAASTKIALEADKQYVLRSVDTTDERALTDSTDAPSASSVLTAVLAGNATLTDRAGTAVSTSGNLSEGDVLTVSTAFDVTKAQTKGVGTVLSLGALADADASAGLSGTFTGISVTGGDGSGMTVDVTLTAGEVVNMTINNGGDDYSVGNSLAILVDHVDGKVGTSPGTITFHLKEISTTTPIYAEVNTGATAFQSGETYVIQDMGTSSGSLSTITDDAYFIAAAFTDENGAALTGPLEVGDKIKMAAVGDTVSVAAGVTQKHLDAANALIQGMTFTMSTDSLTSDIEAVQALVNRARVEAGSQFAALESAVSYTTDLTAQYELGYNTVNDVNFSAETAHLAKNQILQQAATAMLAQANSGQQGLLQLIQG